MPNLVLAVLFTLFSVATLTSSNLFANPTQCVRNGNVLVCDEIRENFEHRDGDNHWCITHPMPWGMPDKIDCLYETKRDCLDTNANDLRRSEAKWRYFHEQGDKPMRCVRNPRDEE